MDKISQSEKLVDNYLNEVSGMVGYTEIKAKADVLMTTCIQQKCENMQNKFDQKICKLTCAITSKLRAVTEFTNTRRSCGNDEKCIHKYTTAIEKYQEKIVKLKENLTKARQDKVDHIAALAKAVS